MPERGGATTQAGILYQNSIGALFLGGLCDTRQLLDSERVSKVRFESTDSVDDIVVTYADDHNAYVQVKLKITKSSEPWRKLWRNLGAQFVSSTFRQDRDRLLLVLGNDGKLSRLLEEICERALDSKTYEEWQRRLTKPEKALTCEINSLVTKPLRLIEPLRLWQHIEVRVLTHDSIQRRLIADWMPRCNKTPESMFHILRDRVAELASRRRTVTSNELRRELLDDDTTLIFDTEPDIKRLLGLFQSASSILRTSKSGFGDTDHHIPRDVVDDIVSWATNNEATDENVAVLIDLAGMGKTVVMHDLLATLEARHVVVIGIKADVQLSEVTNMASISQQLGLDSSFLGGVDRVARLGRVVVLIDQIDALGMSLARDQHALNTTLDMIARLRSIDNVRIVVSCRFYDWNSDGRLQKVRTSKPFRVPPLSPDEIRETLRCAGIDYEDLDPRTQELLTIPLHLHLFMTICDSLVSLPLRQRPVLTTLQDLYDQVWEHTVRRKEPQAPSEYAREQALYQVTTYMENHQRTAMPRLELTKPDQVHMQPAIAWLASAGILTQSPSGWTFMHQSFIDYCFARQVFESKVDFVTDLLNTEQGLDQRLKLTHILTYLRSRDPSRYIYELARLLDSPKLRFHLRSLLLRWFGLLQSPDKREWSFVQARMVTQQERNLLLRQMHGNVEWFNWLKQHLLPLWLKREDDLDAEIIPFLMTVVDGAQSDVVQLIQPYLGRNDDWDRRVKMIMSRIMNWTTIDSAQFYLEMMRKSRVIKDHDLHQLSAAAIAFPQVGCQLIRLVFDQYFGVLQLQASGLPTGNVHEAGHTRRHLYDREGFEKLNHTGIDRTMEIVSSKAPALYCALMLTWLANILSMVNVRNPYPDVRFIVDGLSHNWRSDTLKVRHALIGTLANALAASNGQDATIARKHLQDLAASPYVTAQVIVANAYSSAPQLFCEDALDFLCRDARRLDLGEPDLFDSRRLVSAIFPYLNVPQKTRLETLVLAHMPVYKAAGIRTLHASRIEQMFLLQSLPRSELSAQAQKRLCELERKFPKVVASNSAFGAVTSKTISPIPEHAAYNMSNKDWLRALQKYDGDVRRMEFPYGGVSELSRVLASLIQAHPKRYRTLVEQIPDTVDPQYIKAIIDGVSESNASTAWLFSLIRRFSYLDSSHVKYAILMAVERHAADHVPPDIVRILEDWISSGPGNDELETQPDSGPEDSHKVHLTRLRPTILSALVRIYLAEDIEAAHAACWRLLEKAATDESPALGCGVIYQLSFLVTRDRSHCLDVFDTVVSRHAELIASPVTRDFLYYASYKHFGRVLPYIERMMNDQRQAMQQHGAELACIAALSISAMESASVAQNAQRLAQSCVTGSLAWRRGAARVFTMNIEHYPTACSQPVVALLGDLDDQVQQNFDALFYRLAEEYWFELFDLIDATSRTVAGQSDSFAEYVSTAGRKDPLRALAVVDAIMRGPESTDIRNWGGGIDHLVRLIVNIHDDAVADPTLRRKAIEILDSLSQRYDTQTQKVLVERDQR